MLTSSVLHPPLLAALARAGHGTRVLIADGNFPCSSHSNPEAATIYLNLRPGTLTVDEVLDAVLSVVNVEHAVAMHPGDAPAPAQDDYRRTLGDTVSFDQVERYEFYQLAMAHDTAVVVATGDQRTYANILLTIGLAA